MVGAIRPIDPALTIEWFRCFSRSKSSGTLIQVIEILTRIFSPTSGASTTTIIPLDVERMFIVADDNALLTKRHP
jgi:hypothetical protein